MQSAATMAKKKLSLTGKVVAHNYSPKGEIEGLMVDTKDGLAQLNLPKHGGPIVDIGKKISLEVDPHDQEGDHPVYLMAESPDTLEGRVERFNYSRHGEVNGYHLANGTFVHVKPDGARRSKVAIGDRIRASGQRKQGAHAIVIETDAVKRA